MATVSKTISGATTTFTITDAAGNVLTVASTAGPVTGNTTTLAGTSVHDDALVVLANLLQQLQTGLVPGSGAQGLIP